MKHIRIFIIAVSVGMMLVGCGTSTPTASNTQSHADLGVKAEWQGITFDLPTSMGKQWLGKTVAADPTNSDAPEIWLIAAHEEITFLDYPARNQYQPARILIFAVTDWQNYNPEAVKRIQALTQLLKDKPTSFGAQDAIPVLPVFNAAQVFRARIGYFNFQNGSGVRFITQYDQGPIPINNSELFYTYQGLTTDGKYYVAAFFPITYATLPADNSNASTVVGPDFQAYLDETTKTLDAASDDSFSPAIGTLDKTLQSLKVK